MHIYLYGKTKNAFLYFGCNVSEYQRKTQEFGKGIRYLIFGIFTNFVK